MIRRGERRPSTALAPTEVSVATGPDVVAGPSIDEFWAGISEAMRGESIHVEASTSLGDDLGFDSLDMLELVVVMEDLGAPIPEDCVSILETVGDVYHHYVVRTAVRAAEGSSEPCP
jgi:acyl carrier protein